MRESVGSLVGGGQPACAPTTVSPTTTAQPQGLPGDSAPRGEHCPASLYGAAPERSTDEPGPRRTEHGGLSWQGSPEGRGAGAQPSVGQSEEGTPFLVRGNLFPSVEGFWAVQAEEGGGIRKCILTFLC